MNQKIEDDTQKADDHILVCLSAAPSNLKIIDTAAKMANALAGAFYGSVCADWYKSRSHG